MLAHKSPPAKNVGHASRNSTSVGHFERTNVIVFLIESEIKMQMQKKILTQMHNLIPGEGCDNVALQDL